MLKDLKEHVAGRGKREESFEFCEGGTFVNSTNTNDTFLEAERLSG